MVAQPKLNGSSLHNIQHSAYRCRDAEQTRWFYEDVLGLKLAAVLALGPDESEDEAVQCLHVFFEMGDGNHIAFFDEPDHARPEQFEKKHGFDLHIAFEANDQAALAGWKQRWRSAGIDFSTIDHGFLHSIYCYDPNGIRIEITCKTALYAGYMLQQNDTARQELRRWTEKTRALKKQRLGAQSIDLREHLTAELPPLK
jgi:catechol 2,3-dioxygenase-like lactoylglutathione lyase family enzyme